MTIYHEAPHNLRIICDSCKLPIFNGDMDGGAQQLPMIHTHCKPCCDGIAGSNDYVHKTLIDVLERLLKFEKETRELSLEQKMGFTKMLLQKYESLAKEGRML